MERITIKNISKEFRIGFQKKQGALARILEAAFGRVQKRKILAVNDVSLTVNSGELLGIMGNNGSGKSTLLRLIAGIHKPTKGKGITNGKIVSLINLNIGLKFKLNMKDNIFLVGSLLGMSQGEIKRKFRSIAEFAELKQYTHTKISQFSNGMLQRLVFSIAVNAKPDILLLDEVFEVGDESFKKKSAGKIKELAKNGTAVVLVSHELELIKKHCTRLIWLDESKIRAIGNTKDVLREYGKR